MNQLESLAAHYAANQRQRTRAIESYYASPKFCLNCGLTIEVRPDEKVAQVRIRKFCNQSCSAKFSNHHRVRAKKPKVQMSFKHRLQIVSFMTKAELFGRRKSWQSARSSIRRDAAKVFATHNPNPCCQVCGYSRYIEVAHRRPVSAFPNSALISEINAIQNLLGLCPNHHKEFDHGVLAI